MRRLVALIGLATLIAAPLTAREVDRQEVDERTIESSVKEFASACSNLEQIRKIQLRLERQGWQRIKQSENAFIERRIEEWETSIAAEAGGTREIIGPFAKKYAGRDLLLYIQDTKLPNSRVMDGISSCKMFDIAQPPSQDELDDVFGKKRVRDKYSEEWIYNRTPDDLVGVAWYEPFGVSGATLTTISTRTDKFSGQTYVTYDAGAQHWKPTTGTLRDLPPPIILKPRVKNGGQKGDQVASDD